MNKPIEIKAFEVEINIFENGDVYVSTPGDIHTLKSRHVFIGPVAELKE